MNKAEKLIDKDYHFVNNWSTRLIFLISACSTVFVAVLLLLSLFLIFHQSLTSALVISIILGFFWFIFFFISSSLLQNYCLKPFQKLREIIAVLDNNSLKYLYNSINQTNLTGLERVIISMVKKLNNYDRDIAEEVAKKSQDILTANKFAKKTKLAMINVLEDVESEKERNQIIAKDLEKFKLALDNASDAIVISDQDGLTLYANQAVEIITGYSQAETLGAKAGRLWGNLMAREYYQNLWKTIKLDQKDFVGQIKNKRKNGEVYDSLVSISPIISKDNQVEFFVSIERDITREKDIDNAKTEFVSIVSHQLRTPLSSIKWYAEMLLAGDCGKLSRQQIEIVAEMSNSNQRMLDLINSLLNVSRLDFGDFAIDPQPNDISLIAESVIKELRPMMNEKKIMFSAKYAKNIPLVKLDSQLIRIVFQNILSNAFKYTPVGGLVSLIIKLSARNVLIDIQDSGCGIPREQQDKVFNKFFRATNVKKMDVDGTGLGLYIVKSILDKSGGKISFRTVKPTGTLFTVSIPLNGMKKKAGFKRLT